MPQQQAKLKRTITFPLLVLYGLGTMVGGGFYALLGKVVGETGYAAPFAFLLAGLLAFLSAFSFAELSARFPVSAGEARYVSEAFKKDYLTRLVGLMVIATGAVSAATLSVATAGFFHDLTELSGSFVIIFLVVSMAGLAIWGIGQSVGAIVIITIIEVAALLLVGGLSAKNADFGMFSKVIPNADLGNVFGLVSGAFLSFYAFIGFEDMVNVAEEVQKPKRTLPKAILLSILLTTLLYVLVSFIAVLSVPLDLLKASQTPLATMVGQWGQKMQTGLILVSLLAGINGALVQIIMASRVAYGMAADGKLPKVLGYIHPKTQTPVYATILLSLIILILALGFPLTSLARITSGIILLVFGLVNFSLWHLKGKEGRQLIKKDNIPCYPRWLSFAGFVTCLMLLGLQGIEFL